MTTDFGTDTLCLDSLRTGRRVTGVRRVAQRCYHRLITPRGMLRGGVDEGNFGLDLASLCGSAVTAELESAIGPRIRTELKKDPQVDTVDVDVVSTTVAGVVSWVITISATTAAGPFRLVVGVSDVTVELLGLEAA
jgi:hypothetical protein